MDRVYWIAALVGGAFLVVQTVMIIIGWDDGDGNGGPGGHDHAIEHDSDQGFLKHLSLKTIVAFVTFFGLTGMACQRSGLLPLWTFPISVFAGSIAFFLVGQLLFALARLQSEGSEDLRQCVGTVAKVYLRIPARDSAPGKVTIPLQGRTVECRAFTSGEEIVTGEDVQVIAVIDARTVRVVPLSKD